jgi:hypothetical protein
MNNNAFKIAVCAFLCMGGICHYIHAAESDSAGGVRFSGFGAIETGQYDNYWMLSHNIGHQNLLRTLVNFGASKKLSQRLQVSAFAEGRMYFNTFDKKDNGGVEAFILPSMYYNFYIHEMDAVYSIGDAASPFLQFTFGYFPFKYNPDARDLGEYLYRSGTYPAYLVNDFDFPLARLAGVKISNNLFGMLHQDLLLTVETDKPPFFDLNAGYLVNVDCWKILQIGAGGMYRSLWAANSDLTMTKDNSNMYIKNAVQQQDGSFTGDTGYYTFSGLKLMARISFDPKRLLYPGAEEYGPFGKEDLKLYGEAALLGVKDYPASVVGSNPYGYDTLKNKMPVMLGVNLPAFKILDVFTAEIEWYGCTYPNNFEYKGEPYILPVPCPPNAPLDQRNYAEVDNWKWCVYAKRNFSNGLFVVGQIACDHVRNETPTPSSIDQEEAMRTDRSWWWAIKCGYRF